MKNYRVLLAVVLSLSASLAQSTSTTASALHLSSPIVLDAKQSPAKCHVAPQVQAFKTCTYGPRKSSFHVAIIGDSHLRQYQSAILALAKRYAWSVTYVSKSACPMVDPLLKPATMGNETCRWWNEKRQEYLAAHKAFDLVINSQSSFITHSHRGAGAAYASAVAKITERGTEVLVITDNPKGISKVGECLQSLARTKAGVCNNTRAKATEKVDPMPAAVADNPMVKVADFVSAYCTDTICFGYRSGIKVYRDLSHISEAWAIHLISRLDTAVPAKYKK
jgi:hypothetical protein